MKATIWHNPHCSKSRAALTLLEERGADVTVVEYLKTPFAPGELARLITAAGLVPGEVLRQGEEGAVALMGASDMDVLAAMTADPRLIERPLVETEKGVVLARPTERLLSIL